MNRLRKSIRGVAGGLFFIGMSIQIILGITWIAANFGGFQEFGESCFYVEVSKSFLTDEYYGILYPAVILLARGVEKITGLAYYRLLYLIQLTAACYAAHRFLGAFALRKTAREKGQGRAVRGEARLRDIWGTLCLLTIPMAAQCHLAVLPHSLTTSLFLLMLSYGLEAAGSRPELPSGEMQSGNGVALIKMLILWPAVSLLMPEYRYLAGVPVLCVLAYSIPGLWKHDRRRLMYHTVMVLIFAVVVTASVQFTHIPGAYGRMHKSLAGALAGRCAWPNFRENYAAWPEEVRRIMSEEDAVDFSRNADGVREKDKFGPRIEAAVGVKQAKRLFWQTAAAAFQIRTKDILVKTSLDALSYAAAPAMLEWQLAGYGYDSYAGRNYEIMKNRTPGLTRYYVAYGNWWYAVGTVLALAVLLGRRIGNGKRKAETKTALVRPLALLLLTAAVMVSYYSLSGAGIMDYKNSIFITILWYVLMLRSAGIRNGSTGKEQECGNEKTDKWNHN